MNLSDFKADVTDEVSTILSSSFSISLTNTDTVPHSADGSITFPNLDAKSQGTKVVTTTVLYVDMRRSTQLSLKHQPHTVARLYSAFVRAMARCADQYGGHVRGIIGDRVMILFDQKDCYKNAIYTAALINSVCKYIINENFEQGEISFGIGIDYGRMLATKTGVRRNGALRQSYHALVWLGRPANVASKLTDAANKKAETLDYVWVKVAFVGSLLSGGLRYQKVSPHEFVKQFGLRTAAGFMPHNDPTFHSFSVETEKLTLKEETPPILMSKRVFDGYRTTDATAAEISRKWIKQIPQDFPDVPDLVYGCNLIFSTFEQ